MKTVWVVSYNFSSEVRVASSIDKAFELCCDEIRELYYNADEEYNEEYNKVLSELIESFKEAKDNDYYRFGADDIVDARRADLYED